MGYIDKTYYRDTYKGIAVSTDAELDTLIARASEVVDTITNDVIAINTLASYPTYIQSKVKLATAKQVEYYALNGYTSSIRATGQSVTIGSFSLGNGSASSESKSAVKNGYSPDCVNLLASAGLIVRGVYVCY